MSKQGLQNIPFILIYLSKTELKMWIKGRGGKKYGLKLNFDG